MTRIARLTLAVSLVALLSGCTGMTIGGDLIQGGKT